VALEHIDALRLARPERSPDIARLAVDERQEAIPAPHEAQAAKLIRLYDQGKLPLDLMRALDKIPRDKD
jgi:hypothetical protein